MRKITFILFLQFLIFPHLFAFPVYRADSTKPCHSFFTAAPNPSYPLEVHFTDQSTGNIYEWNWTFGDGATSGWQNPIHIYGLSKFYEVCLTILSVDSTGYCTDTFCDSVWAGADTLKYFDLGGHIFAGLYPINNPDPTGDTAIAGLYRIQDSQLILVDTNLVTYLGYYTFPGTAEGDYILKAELTPESYHYSNYLPTFFPHAKTWEDATLIHLADSSIFNADIQLVPTINGLPEYRIDQAGSPFPSPAEDRIALPVNLDKPGLLIITVTDLMGRVMVLKEIHADKGPGVIPVDLNFTGKGLFIIQIRNTFGDLDRSFRIIRK